jgi:hypothetical protein
MKVRLLTSMSFPQGPIGSGEEVDVLEAQAAELLRLGLAESSEEDYDDEPEAATLESPEDAAMPQPRKRKRLA